MKHLKLAQDFIFDDSFFSVEDPEPVPVAEIANAPEETTVAAAAAPAIDKSRLMKPGDWSERKATRGLLVGKSRPVVMQKKGSRIQFVPHTIGAAAMLQLAGFDQYFNGKSWSQEISTRPKEHIGFRMATRSNGRISFEAHPWFETSFDGVNNEIREALDCLGVEIVMPPSIENWVRKTWSRYQLEKTSLELPNVKDERPLFERLEMGLLLKCTTSRLGFHNGETYVVVETPEERGAKASNDEDEDKEEKPAEQNTQESAGNDTSFKLLRVNASWYEKPLEYSVLDGPMENMFVLEMDNAKLYDPDKCIPAKYPHLIRQYESRLKKNEKLWNGLYLHARKDAPQGACLRHVFLGDGMRLGKAQPLDAKILTPTGWKSMGDLQVGDEIMHPSGGTQTVTGVFPQGKKLVYQVGFRDGAVTECCDDHLWSVIAPRRKNQGYDYQVKPLNAIRNNLVDGTGNSKHFIPMVKPMEFTEQNVPLDPYALGLLLGDGGIGANEKGYGTPGFTTVDSELLGALETIMAPSGVEIKRQGASYCNYHLTARNSGSKRNPLVVILEQLNLRHTAESKFVPDVYKFSSIEHRRAVLSGLLDTDGCCSNGKNQNSASTIEYSSISERLVDDVRFIVQSLGGTAKKSSRIPKLRYKGELREGARSYRLRITLPPGWNPFRLKRKADKYRETTKFHPNRSIYSVVPVSEKECQCISVSAQDGLYVTDDCIVTHNTSKAIAVLEAAGTQKIGIVIPPNARAGFYRELLRLGIPESSIVVVQQEQDLHRSGRWFLMTYNWLKRGKETKMFKPEANWPTMNNLCPHCGITLSRPVQRSIKLADGKKKFWTVWSSEYGFMCRNKACSFTRTRIRSRGAAWGTNVKDQTPIPAKAYVDWEMAKIVNLFNRPEKLGVTRETTNIQTGEKSKTFEMKPRSRQERVSGWVKKSWTPAMYKRAKKLFNGLIVDEIHWIKSGTTDQARAILNLRAKRTVGLTGTLMPNTPQDAFYPLSWIFGSQNHRFPYKANKDGVSQFNHDFTEQITVQTSENTRYRRRASYLKSPIKFWTFMAPKMLRRGYNDPLVVQSFAEAGVCMPSWEIKTINIQPSPAQAQLIVSSIDEFKKAFAEYKELQKAQNEIVNPSLLNQALVLRQMSALRVAATCPGWLVEKEGVYHSIEDNVNAMFGQNPYKGTPGGCKMPIVKQIVAEKVAEGGKILILSDFRYNQKLLEKELFLYDPIRFDTSWSEQRRVEAFDAFQNPKSKHKVFIAGPRAVREGVDLSAADTCICTDLLWTPGLQQQGWFRILTPTTSTRHCEIILLVTRYSIDTHVYSTFYSKMTAAEQALDRRILSKKEKEIDIQYFVDAVLSERNHLMEYIREAAEEGEELVEIPLLMPAVQKFLEVEA